MKALALAVVVIVVLAFAAHKQQETASTVTCGTVTGGTTMTAKGVDWAQEFGEWIHDLAETPVGPETVKAAVKGVEKVLWYWIRTWFLSSKGLKLDPEIFRLKEQAAAARAAAEQQCTPCPQALPQDSSPLASIGAAAPVGSPEEITRQVAARYWPASEVDMAVAIAGAESSFNPKAHNNYGTGVDGLWQINRQAHRALVAGKDLQDPAVNAALAYRIWSDAGNSWTPWTTYTNGAYKRFLKPSAAAAVSTSSGTTNNQYGSANPAPTAPVNPQNAGCQSGAMPDLRIATWNTFCGPSLQEGCKTGDRLAQRTARVLRGMTAISKQADIINTQEMSSAELRQRIKVGMPGWSVAGGNTSHPIFVRDSACQITEDHAAPVFKRGTPMEGPDQGDRWIVAATLNCGGKTLTDINFHQLPKIQRGTGYAPRQPQRNKQADEIFAAAMTSARIAMNLGPVVLAGDMNWTGTVPGSQQAGLTSAASVFGNLVKGRDIDQIMFSAGAPATYKVLDKWGSDHAARLLTFAGSATVAAGGTPVSLTLANSGGRTVMDGKSISSIAAAQIRLAEQKSGIDFKVMQGDLGGSHIAASGTSHNYSGVVDLSPGSIEAETALRQAGFAAWARNIPGRSSVGSGEHIHAVSLLDPGAAKSPQITGSWANNGNGLSGYHNDPAPHLPYYPELAQAVSQQAQ